jgi:transcriptional regulator with XRE-family HTH domain
MAADALAAAEQVPVTVAFGRRVRELRRECEWSLRHLGGIALLDAATLHRIEAGGGTTLDAADRIASAFGVPLAVMLSPDSCWHCHGAPGRGFICGTCGAAGPEVAQ